MISIKLPEQKKNCSAKWKRWLQICNEESEKNYWKQFVFAYFTEVNFGQLPEYVRTWWRQRRRHSLQKFRNETNSICSFRIQYSHSNPTYLIVYASVFTNVCIRCKWTVFVLCLFACACVEYIHYTLQSIITLWSCRFGGNLTAIFIQLITVVRFEH